MKASNFLVFHTILRYSSDFTESLRWARKLTDEISEAVNKDLPEEQQVKIEKTKKSMNRNQFVLY